MDVVALQQARAQGDKRYSRKGYRSSVLSGNAVIAGRVNGFTYNGTNLSNGTDTQGVYRYAHPVFLDATDIRLLYGNFYNGYAVGPNNITVKCALEWPGVSAYGNGGEVGYTFGPMFRGQRSTVIEPGGWALSDPITMAVKAGQYLYSRTFVSVASAGQKWPLDLQTVNNPFVEGQKTGTSGIDVVDTGAQISAYGAGAGFGYGPVAIVGNPVSAANPLLVGIRGDSIAYGSGDTPPNGLGFVVRALQAAKIPYLQTAKPGEAAQDRIAGGLVTPQPRDQLIVPCTHVIEEYAHNDRVVYSRTLAQIQADRISLWTLDGLQRGAKVFATTETPHTTSTDSWATPGNQTVSASESTRTNLNSWLRDGAPLNSSNLTAAATGASGAGVIRAGSGGHPLAGVFDAAATVEVNSSGTATLNGGFWKTSGSANGYTVDGTHPSVGGHTAMAAAIDTTKLV